MTAAARSPRRFSRWVPVTALAAVAVLGAWGAAALSGRTHAALYDEARLNTTMGSGLRFDIALVQDGVLRQAEGDGLSWAVPASDGLVPGHAVTFDVPVVNNGPYDADVRLTVEDRHAETSATGVGSDPVELYRWSVADAETGGVLAGTPHDPLGSTVTTDGLGAALGSFELAARTLPPVADGAAWQSGAPGEHRVLRVTIAYPDTPAATPYNGGHSVLALVFEGESR